MLDSLYESHTYQDPNFHIIFHTDTIIQGKAFATHWHESIEMIYIVEGVCTVHCGLKTITAHPGEIVIINCNELHHFEAQTESTTYHCLIVNQLIPETFGVPINEVLFENKITSATLVTLYNQIVCELVAHQDFYQLAVKTQFTYLIIQLLRHHTYHATTDTSSVPQDSKIRMTKEAILYIRKNLTVPFTLEDICHHVGFSKHYFCHVFKEITGQTLTQYINYSRCEYAKQLLGSGQYTVAETAEMCGYNHLTYFTKNFKRHVGKSPSAFKSK